MLDTKTDFPRFTLASAERPMVLSPRQALFFSFFFPLPSLPLQLWLLAIIGPGLGFFFLATYTEMQRSSWVKAPLDVLVEWVPILYFGCQEFLE